MTTEIVNGNTTEEFDQWIDRRTQFGNPFAIEDYKFLDEEQARTLVIKLYRHYFEARIRNDEEFRQAVKNLKGKKLACHCKPEPCHGDIIKRWLEDETFIQNGREWSKPELEPLPDKVDCPECGGEAPQIGDDQLFKCEYCGYETVVIR